MCKLFVVVEAALKVDPRVDPNVDKDVHQRARKCVAKYSRELGLVTGKDLDDVSCRVRAHTYTHTHTHTHSTLQFVPRSSTRSF